MGIEKPRRPSPPPPPPVVETSASLVLGDDDLLREILLRVGLPTSLLRGALVCRRWCRLASDPAFLRRFRARHPPRLLGVYLASAPPRPRFLPIRPLPELAAPSRRAAAFFDAAFQGSSASILDARGGHLLVSAFDDRYESTQFVCSPLSPAGDTAVVPPPPPPPPIELTSDEECLIYHYGEFLRDAGGRSYFSVVMGYGEQQTTVHLYELRGDMSWAFRASAAAQLPVSPPKSRVVLFDNTRFYMLSTINKILVCDFPSSSISPMDLPHGVENEHDGCITLSRGDDSGIFLIHVKDSLLRVFHFMTAADDPGDWFLVDTVSLREVCTSVGMEAWPPILDDGQSTRVKIRAVGDNASFVLLEMFGAILFLDITTKLAEKVYEMTPVDKELVSIHPLMTIWPPVFPVLNEGSDRND